MSHRGDHNTGIQVRSTLDFGPMQTIEHLAKVCGESGEDFGSCAAHGHQSHAGFCICRRFGVEDEADGIDLCFPAAGQIISIACTLAVVADDDCRLETHDGRSSPGLVI